MANRPDDLQKKFKNLTLQQQQQQYRDLTTRAPDHHIFREKQHARQNGYRSTMQYSYENGSNSSRCGTPNSIQEQQGNRNNNNKTNSHHKQSGPPLNMEKYNHSENILADILAEKSYMRAIEIVNNLHRARLIDMLSQAKITFTKGNLVVLRKRCKCYIKKRFSDKEKPKSNAPNSFRNTPPRYCVVIDYEATCDRRQAGGARDADNYPHEIIEFPALIVDLNASNGESYLDENGRTRSPTDLHIVDTFHRYVRPIQYPILTDYCKLLTGIKQEWIDQAKPFTYVLEEFYEFLNRNGLNPNTGRVVPTKKNNLISPVKQLMQQQAATNASSGPGTPNDTDSEETAKSNASTPAKTADTSASSNTTTPPVPETSKKTFITPNFNVEKWICLTDGPFDFAKFLRLQCETSEIHFPKWAKRWINLKRLYASFYSFNGQNVDFNNKKKGANSKFMRLDEMLSNVGLEFVGKPHSGIDDARNITRVLIQLKTDGAIPVANEQMDLTARDFYSAIMIANKNRFTKITSAQTGAQTNRNRTPHNSGGNHSGDNKQSPQHQRNYNQRQPSGGNGGKSQSFDGRRNSNQGSGGYSDRKASQESSSSVKRNYHSQNNNNNNR